MLAALFHRATIVCAACSELGAPLTLLHQEVNRLRPMGQRDVTDMESSMAVASLSTMALQEVSLLDAMNPDYFNRTLWAAREYAVAFNDDCEALYTLLYRE